MKALTINHPNVIIVDVYHFSEKHMFRYGAIRPRMVIKGNKGLEPMTCWFWHGSCKLYVALQHLRSRCHQAHHDLHISPSFSVSVMLSQTVLQGSRGRTVTCIDPFTCANTNIDCDISICRTTAVGGGLFNIYLG